MGILEGTNKLGNGTPTTTDALAVTCPECQETVFTEKVGEVDCRSCGYTFYASEHRSEECVAVECTDCGEVISFIREHRFEIGKWDSYYCHYCDKILAIETPEGRKPINQTLQTEWILDGQLTERGEMFNDGYWIIRAQTDREKFATELLNIEARENDGSFNNYVPEVNSHLCFAEDHCIGYIIWEWNGEKPQLGQIYILPQFRQRGIGSSFVDAWGEEVVGSYQFLVHNPNENMFRLLRSIGVIKLTEDGIECTDCDISGHYFDLPGEWS